MTQSRSVMPGCVTPVHSPESSSSTLPQKRKASTDDVELSTSQLPDGSKKISDITKGEYEAGLVTCEVCGESVSFRDDNGFTLKHWDAHRQQCGASSSQSPPEPVIYTPESTAEALANPPPKRRRAKRTEEERIAYLREDPYVAQFEAYRVLCASCDKWIRLRPNSTYCSIPWDAHRKSCLSRKINNKNTYALEERNALFLKDPDVRKYDAERVLCNMCDTWVPVSPEDHLRAVQTWLSHRSMCHKVAAGLMTLEQATRAASEVAKNSQSSSGSPQMSTADSVPPLSAQQLALASLHLPPHPRPMTSVTDSSPFSPPSKASQSLDSPSSFKDLYANNFAPVHESRRRNAEQRAATLRADSLVAEVEPNRVFCSLCQKWVQLRQDSSYCAYPWLQHRGKCLARHQRRLQKGTDGDLGMRRDSSQSRYQTSEGGDQEDELESDEDIGEEEKAWRREHQRAKTRAVIHDGIGSRGPARTKISRDTDGESIMADGASQSSQHVPRRSTSVGLADLDSPSGRKKFVFACVGHLFSTTYENTDDMTISALLTYLNAAMPPDKHEDFDTGEVIRAAAALQDRGDIVFEGDTLRLPE